MELELCNEEALDVGSLSLPKMALSNLRSRSRDGGLNAGYALGLQAH